MKVLLDECMSVKLAHRLMPEHDVYTVRGLGWHSKSDGEVLTKMVEEGFGAFITNDGSIPYQHNWELYPIRVLILQAVDNR